MPKSTIEPESSGQPKRKAPPHAFGPGNNANPHGRAGKPKPPAEPDPEGGVVTAARMRKVLGQGKASDAGPTEKELRRWLDKDARGYMAAIDQKAKGEGEAAAAAAEVDRLRGRVAELEAAVQKAGPAVAGDDPGTEAALELVEKLLKEAGDEPRG